MPEAKSVHRAADVDDIALKEYAIMRPVSGIVVVAFGIALIVMAVVSAIKPEFAERALESFASSARAHYTEQAVRLCVGAAMILFSPFTLFPDIFNYFGWIVIVTTTGLLLIPWHWHHRFAMWTIPWAIRHLKFYAVSSFTLGAFILYATFRAAVA